MWASERGARELEVPVSGNDPESLSFAQRRGFTEERREVNLVLGLAGISPRQVQPPAAIEIVIWAQRPELARGMYDVDLEVHPDIPGFEDDQSPERPSWLPIRNRADPPSRPHHWRTVSMRRQTPCDVA